jgi:hypothetical protein
VIFFQVLSELLKYLTSVKAQFTDDKFRVNPVFLREPSQLRVVRLDNARERRGCGNIVLEMPDFHLE